MLYDLLIFMPVAACLFWIVIYGMMASRTSAFPVMCTVMVVMALYLFTDYVYVSPYSPPLLMVVSTVLSQVAAPSLFPLIWLHLKRMEGQKQYQASQMVWLIIPAVMGTATLMLTLLEGTEAIAQYQAYIYSSSFDLSGQTLSGNAYAYYAVIGVAFRSVVACEALAFGVQVVRMMFRNNLRLRHMRRFYFEGGRVQTLELMVFAIIGCSVFFVPKILLRREFLISHLWISAVLAILITASLFGVCMIALFSEKKTLSLREIRNGFRYNYNDENKDEIVEAMIGDLVDEAEAEALKRIRRRIGSDPQDADGPDLPAIPSLTSGLFTAMAKSWDDDSLLARFENLVLREQLFLNPGLTLGDVAERMHTNKTYVSRLVNNTYNLPFPDLINTLRIDYAEQYIVLHRDAKQKEIAAACGFTSASTFNNIFKKVTGMTPKIWLATLDQQDGQAPVEADSSAR